MQKLSWKPQKYRCKKPDYKQHTGISGKIKTTKHEFDRFVDRFYFFRIPKPYKIRGFRKLLTGIGLYSVPESLQNQGGMHTVYSVSTIPKYSRGKYLFSLLNQFIQTYTQSNGNFIEGFNRKVITNFFTFYLPNKIM